MSSSDMSTRTRILRAAETLFAQASYARVSMRAIASASGVHLGALPYHFGTKEALYRAIWEEWQGELDARALLKEARLQPKASREEELTSLVEAFFAGPRNLLRDPRGRYFVSIMVREAQDPTSGERTLLADFIYPNGNLIRQALADLFHDLPADALDASFDMMIAALRIVIERGSKSGTLPAPEQTEPLFDLLTDFVVQGWMAVCRRCESEDCQQSAG
ncbi:TetR/AcrR family transcriptional regulator [Novosphingobium flavum]|uniref:TetR/AcrR family transcriptional regulator n=1 Tax=Novosphingobium flavum TaxID=1778672 RepID=A0A7X1FNQ8_9SPHN|nr:TetR/AcrR family transcriptional regulator [Novosphingobium flavum]MBC2664189.1 TetR/AcrR family transcriptional regulator [Novosphingobium flavum]